MKTKIIHIRDELSDELDEMKEEIKQNGGGPIPISRLMQDALEIFVRFYKKDAIEKYSPIYKMKGD